MAAIIKYVKPEHVEVLDEYLNHGGVALIYPDVQPNAQRAGLTNNKSVKYEFGGQADILVEKVESQYHYLFQDKKK